MTMRLSFDTIVLLSSLGDDRAAEILDACASPALDTNALAAEWVEAHTADGDIWLDG
jgi:hypothetical protein